MRTRATLPGSAAGPEDDVEAGGGAISANRATRLSAGEWAALAEVAQWWRHRREVGDSADPLETHFGGIDGRATVQTAGLVPATISLPKPLLIGAGASLLVTAFGVPTDAAETGRCYSLAGLCHFYRDATAGIISQYATIGRAPADVTSTEVRSGVGGAPPSAVLSLVGVSGETINWKVEWLRVEVG